MTAETKILPVEELKGLLARGDIEGAGALLASLHPADIASLFDELEGSQIADVLGLLAKETAAPVILELDERLRESVLAAATPAELVELIGEMATDDATDIVAELPREKARQVLDGINRRESIEVQKLLKYAEDTAGGIMQTELISVREDATVRDTIAEIRRKSRDVERVANVFVVGEGGRLAGTVSLDKLILSAEDLPVKAITDVGPLAVTTDVDQEEVARMFQRYDLLSMPVVDKSGRLVGRITVDDVIDVMEEEIFEDFYKMASLSKGEGVLDSPGRSFRLRSPWLLLNLGTAFLAASVVKVFEGTIESLVILAVFMPVVAGVGGNAATQTITVIVRGLALGNLDLGDAWKVLRKEGLVGLSNGLVVGLAAAAVSSLFGANAMIGLLMFFAITANLVIAGLSGAVIPLALKWLGADPALSSSVFVTTCTDIGGFFTFLGLAAVFINMGLL